MEIMARPQTGASLLAVGPRVRSGAMVFSVFLLVILSPGAWAQESIKATPALESADARDQAFSDAVFGALERNPERILALLESAVTAQQVAEKTEKNSAVQAMAAQADTLPFPYHGAADGDVTIIEFSDYSCPYCKEMMPILTYALSRDERLRLIFVDWPIFGANSQAAARAALAARQQERYFEAHQALMKWPHPFTQDDFAPLADQLGIDLARLERDARSPRVDEILDQAFSWAEKMGLSGTPSMIINGTLVARAVDYGKLKQLIATARADLSVQ